MPTASRSGDVKSSMASDCVRRVSLATFSPIALNPRSLIFPRSSASSPPMDLVLEAFDGEGGVVTTEAKAVAEDSGDLPGDADDGRGVESQLGIRMMGGDRRRNYIMSNNQRSD